MAIVVDNIQKLIGGRYFLVLEKGVLLTEGIVLNALNADFILVDFWREGNSETTTTHILALSDMTWDERTQTGFVLTQQKA
jgi:hypothetical protein